MEIHRGKKLRDFNTHIAHERQEKQQEIYLISFTKWMIDKVSQGQSEDIMVHVLLKRTQDKSYGEPYQLISRKNIACRYKM